MKESISQTPGLTLALGLTHRTSLEGAGDKTFFYSYSLEWAAFSVEAPDVDASACENAAIGSSISTTIR